jgi:hypothetical protein
MSNTPPSPHYGEQPHHDAMDVLSIIFFLVAGALLIAALLYVIFSLYFLHMHSSNGTLGDVYDDLPWFFRRFARHLQMGTHHHNQSPHHHVRFMTKDERRAAVQSVLARREEEQQQQQQAAGETTTRTAADVEKGAGGTSSPSSSSSLEEDPTIPVVTTTAKNDDDHDIEQCIGGGTAGETETDDHDDNLDDNETPLCSICLCGFEPGDEDNIYHPCPQRHHAFHKNCILDWLQLPNQNDCPCCRSLIIDENVVWRAVQNLRRRQQRQKQRQVEQQQQQQRRKQQQSSQQQQQQQHQQQADNDLSETEQIDYDDDDDDDHEHDV